MDNFKSIFSDVNFFSNLFGFINDPGFRYRVIDYHRASRHKFAVTLNLFPFNRSICTLNESLEFDGDIWSHEYASLVDPLGVKFLTCLQFECSWHFPRSKFVNVPTNEYFLSNVGFCLDWEIDSYCREHWLNLLPLFIFSITLKSKLIIKKYHLLFIEPTTCTF